MLQLIRNTRRSSLKNSAIKRAVWQLPDNHFGSSCQERTAVGQHGWHAVQWFGFARHEDPAHGQHTAGWHRQAAGSTVSSVRSHHQYLELNAGLCHSSEGSRLPVRLFRLFPHYYIKARAVLITKNKASIVVICHCVHMESALKVNAVKSRVTWGYTQVKNHSEEHMFIFCAFSAAKLESQKRLHTNSKARITVHSLHNFHPL